MTTLTHPQSKTRSGAASAPIANHGVIGDLRTVALVATDGTIDWYCPLTFDSPSVFAAILDNGQGGHYRIAPIHDCVSKQLYLPDTNVLVTRFLSPDGVGELQDFMPVLPAPALLASTRTCTYRPTASG